MDLMMSMIPSQERPRERFITSGVSALSNAELLAIILKTGTRGISVKYVAIDLLKEIGDITSLANQSIQSLTQIKGIGLVKAMELLVVVELGKRIFLSSSIKSKDKMDNPSKIWELTNYLFRGKKQEYFFCMYLNTKRELIERKLLFIGTINRSIVHPREIFKEAYLTSASAIICIHNHPSNDLTPSVEDLKLTESLVEIGKMNGIPVIDHLIVSDMGYYSFYEHGNI
ncbi:MAG: DNA repair protein RadC [Bacilli bacterium]